MDGSEGDIDEDMEQYIDEDMEENEEDRDFVVDDDTIEYENNYKPSKKDKMKVMVIGKKLNGQKINLEN